MLRAMLPSMKCVGTQAFQERPPAGIWIKGQNSRATSFGKDRAIWFW